LQVLTSKVTIWSNQIFSLQYNITVALHSTATIPKISIFVNLYETLAVYEVTGSDYIFFKDSLNTVAIGSSARKGTFDYIKISGQV